MWCFVRFDLDMCFAPQRRALFRHLNFRKWSGTVIFLQRRALFRPLNFQKLSANGVLWTFWLRNVLRATTAYTFSASQFFKSGSTMWCFVHFDLETCFAPQGRALFRPLNFQKLSANGVLWTFWLRNVLRATTAGTFSTSQLPKVVRPCGALYVLTWKCASRHNGVHFFDLSTSKSCPRTVCFGHFDLETCFAPQRRALFRHLNFQKLSKNVVLCTFWLGNVLHATTACNFSFLIWPDGSASAALASLLFDPPEPQIIGKTQWIATFLPFCARASSFFSLFLFSDLLTSFLGLPDSSHLCFSTCPYCRKLDF